MKTISQYRQAAVGKRPRSLPLITLAIAAAFLAGIMVGSVLPVAGPAAVTAAAGLEYLGSAYQEVIVPAFAQLNDNVHGLIESSLSGLEPELPYTLGP